MTRATPLSPDARRETIINAARPLLATHGANFTTRQVAEAAGIAEGTIFRVFANKGALVHAVLDAVLDPQPLCAAIADLPETDSLETRVSALVGLILNNTTEMSQVIGALHSMPTCTPEDADAHSAASIAAYHERVATIQTALAGALEPFHSQIGPELATAAFMIRSFAFMCAHPLLTDAAAPKDPTSITALIMRGLQPAKD